MEPWQILVAVASLALVGVTFLLARSGAVPVRAAVARIVGYALTAVLALVGVTPLLAIVPAVVGIAIGYVFVVREHRAG